MNFIFPILPFAIFIFIFQILYPQLGKAYFLPVPVYSLVPLYLFVRLSLRLPPSPRFCKYPYIRLAFRSAAPWSLGWTGRDTLGH